METIENAYKYLFQREIPQEATQRLADEAEALEEMRETYRQADSKVLAQMISMGYDPSSVAATYEEISVFGTALREKASPADVVTAYHDEVTTAVLAEAQKEGRAQQERVMNMFRSLREANAKKYSEAEQSEAFQRFQDGQIIVAILRNHFPPLSAYYTLRDAAGYDNEAANQMLQSAGIVKLLYADIQNTTLQRPEECRNEMALYRYLAKERMMKSGLKTFDFEDDLAIVRRMHELHIPKELIENAVRRASPVMREIGRDAEKYWEAMATDVFQEAAEHRQDPYVAAKNIYLSFIQQANDKLQQKGYQPEAIQRYRVYYDGLAVRELFTQHQKEPHIQKVLEELSPAAKTRSDYASWLMEKIRYLIKKEISLLSSYKELPGNVTSYKTLFELGYTAAAVYKAVLGEHIKLNPSLTQHIYEPFVDKDVAETFLTKYKDTDREALLGVLNDTPRAILMKGTGLPEEKHYGESVLRAVEQRIAEFKKQEAAQNEMKALWLRQLDLQTQGMEGKPADIMLKFQIGSIALSMKERGWDDTQIRSAILSTTSFPENMKDAEELANAVMERLPAVYERREAIKRYTPDEDTEKTALSDYRQKLHEKYATLRYFKPQMDVDIVKYMLAEGAFSRDNMKDAILKASPMAIAPGRDVESYFGYVYQKARELLYLEKKKLQEFQLSPRQPHAESAKEEYDIQKQRVKFVVDLPFNQAMDILIAQSLLQEGFDEESVKGVLDTSDLAVEQENYGIAILNGAKRKMEDENINQAEEQQDVQLEHPAQQTQQQEATPNEEEHHPLTEEEAPGKDTPAPQEDPQVKAQTENRDTPQPQETPELAEEAPQETTKATAPEVKAEMREAEVTQQAVHLLERYRTAENEKERMEILLFAGSTFPPPVITLFQNLLSGAQGAQRGQEQPTAVRILTPEATSEGSG